MSPFLFSGHAIDPDLSPIYKLVGAGGGSFFDAPFVLYDALYSYDGTNSVRQSLVWTASGVTLETIVSPDLSQTPINTVPLQFHTSRPGTPPGGSSTLAVRLLTDGGPEPFSFAAGAEGVWLQMNTTRQWQIARPASGVTVINTSIYEMAFWADTTAIKARAEIAIQYARP